jgi:DNA mismatch repair protein MutS2
VTRQPAAPRLNTGEAGAARLQAQAAIDEVAERLRAGIKGAVDAPSEEGTPPHAPGVGDRVKVGGLGLEGVLVSVQGRHAEVDVRGKRMRARLADLRVSGVRATGPTPSATVRVNVTLQPREEISNEINVIGCDVDEALARTERLLDETLVTDQKTVRVVHGYGTGQLRRAIAGLLTDHPQVASFHHAPPSQGGDGVTVVELKE